MPKVIDVIDRFRVFKRRIEAGFDREQIKGDLRRESREYGYELRKRLRELAPSGKKWEDPPQITRDIRRPSLRQHGITLEDSWQDPIIDFIGSTGTTIQASVSVSSTAPQAQWVIEGTPAHFIPVRDLDDNLYFWHFRESAVVRSKIVSHPETAPNDFVFRAVEQTEEQAKSRFGQMIDLIMNRLK